MNFVKFLLIQHFFDILFFNILWTVAQTPVKNTIFWKSVMRSFRWIDLNCSNRFRFFAEISTNLQKMHYFGQFNNHNSGRKKRKLDNYLISCYTFTSFRMLFCIASKLGFWNFRPILIRIKFLLFATFFLYFWLSLWVEICIYKLSRGFLTFI